MYTYVHVTITNGALIHYVCNLYKYTNYYVTVLFDYNCNNAMACVWRAVHEKYLMYTNISRTSTHFVMP